MKCIKELIIQNVHFPHSCRVSAGWASHKRRRSSNSLELNVQKTLRWRLKLINFTIFNKYLIIYYKCGRGTTSSWKILSRKLFYCHLVDSTPVTFSLAFKRCNVEYKNKDAFYTNWVFDCCPTSCQVKLEVSIVSASCTKTPKHADKAAFFNSQLALLTESQLLAKTLSLTTLILHFFMKF